MDYVDQPTKGGQSMSDEQEAAYQKACAEVEAKREVVREYIRWEWDREFVDASDELNIQAAFPLPERPKKLRVVELDNGERYRCRDGIVEWQWRSEVWQRSTIKIDELVAIASLKDRPYED